MIEQTETRKTMSRSALTLVARQTTIQAFSLFASVILARILTPRDFGLYAIIGFFLQFLTLVSDGGIGAGLIQQGRKPRKDTYAIAFTLIQLLYFGACVLAVPGALLFAHLYRSMSLNIWMIYTFILEFYLSSFRVIPAAKLERSLKYTKLAVVETCEYFSFQVVTVVLAFLGHGVWSFVFGALVSRVVGLVLLYTLSPYMPRLRFERDTARRLMRFGAAMQLANVLSFAQNSISPSFVAFKLGTAAVGFSNFSYKVGSYPTYPLNAVRRMMFPLLSRIQDNEKLFRRTLNDIIRVSNIVLFGTTAVLLGVVPDVVKVVFGSKWMPSVELIYGVLFGTLLLGYTSPIYAAIQAKGRGRVFLMTSGLSAFVSWIVAIPAVILFGYNGLMAMYLSTLLTFPVLLVMARKYVKVRIWAHFWRPACALAATYVTQRLVVDGLHPHTLASVLVCVLFGVLPYSIVIFTLDKKVRRWTVSAIVKILHQGSPFGRRAEQHI
ncbi:oligosaccharide flippase family protein [Alicyclobacillus sp. ALC3]|uniref:oligosaccharide flippase family protein n=1 Tax=Alicyclobacillus sp. ALC3 TaxID=2796143 RepID=UPI002379A580|nr:oligosaccharide flippase family protein [Alicyclobacillus sp. ALC3]WDL95261.1 oligosaccharide flippase family protein [Alicyclobacillus sp. ALC3]